jgi:hypothetical protein
VTAHETQSSACITAAFSSMVTVAEQSERFLAELANRKRRPVKPATLKVYDGFLRNWIVPTLGSMDLAAIDNGVMKKFVNFLVDRRLAPATINGAVTTLKMLVKREWNSTVIDAPAIDPDAQDAPVISGRALNVALSKAANHYREYYALAAGSGLRMGEMLALKMGPDLGNGSVLDLEQGIVFVRTIGGNNPRRAWRVSARWICVHHW